MADMICFINKHIKNGAQFLNATSVLSPVTKINAPE